jgi:hypothetical protein
MKVQTTDTGSAPIPEQGAQFNGALATLQRIDSSLRLACDGFMQSRPDVYCRAIINAWRECAPFVDNEAILKKGDELENKAEHCVSIFMDSMKQHKQFNPYFTLKEFDVFVRKQLNEQGLLMPRGDDPRRVIMD